MHPWITSVITSVVAFARGRWQARHDDDQGATSIEWTIFALLALLVAGAVAGAITAAVEHRLPGIQ